MSPVSKGRKKKHHTTKRPPGQGAGTMYPLKHEPEGSREEAERRRFAMPFGGTRVGGEDYRFLDPADPDDRRLLIIGDHHPAFHVVWTEPDNEDLLDGINPRLHITIDEAIINQLWDDNPPEVWAAAQRLTSAGHSRRDIIHAVADLFVHHMHPVLTHHVPFDEAAYRADLDALR